MVLSAPLLITCIAIAIVSVVYFFFWNRILGFSVGFFVRLALWTQSSSGIWVDVSSAHVSLIAGRILLRDVRYHSSNQTFRIVKCQLNWRWWIRTAAEEEDLEDAQLDESDNMSDRMYPPRCRIHASIEGFEWFMYNRTASFDYILSRLASTDSAFAELRAKSRDSNAQSLNPSVPDRNQAHPRATFYSTGRRALSGFRVPSFFDSLIRCVKRQLPDLDKKNLLPLSFEASKGAITMGNHTAENVFMAHFAHASGTYGIVQSRSKLDIHKQLLRVAFKESEISCVENHDFWASSQNIGKGVHECVAKTDPVFRYGIFPLSFNDFGKLWTRCRVHFLYYKSRGRRYGKSDRDKEHKKKEKGRNAQEDTSHVGADFTTLEYAIDRKLLEAPTIELTYYADVAGVVPDSPLVHDNRSGQRSATPAKDIEHMDVGNVDLPPEWGVELVVHGGAIRYGPWADRQRAHLQRIFFPQMFQNAVPTELLAPGDQRGCTCLKLFFEFRGVTTIHLPFREASKNWQWDGLVDVPRNRKQREAASIQLRIGDKSSVKYLVPMIASTEGYIAKLDVFMDNISVTSSLNDIRLLEADSCLISSYLPSPLRWDSERSWNFDVELDRPVLYLIRDHINMLTDLGKDWSSGPPNDFNTFVPITYSFFLTFTDYELNLYANDHNIIDRPLERQQNVLFTLKGDTLKNDTFIPSNKFRALSSTVSFYVYMPNVALSLTLPRWNTHAISSSAAMQVTDIGHTVAFRLDGSYTYHAEVREDCIDQLKLDVKVPSPALKLFGWIIRHVMVLRENYFGAFTHYSTTKEYLSKCEKGIAVGDPLELKYRPGKSNIFHFDLTLVIEKWSIALPAGLFGFERAQSPETNKTRGVDMGPCAVFAIPELQVQLRLHDYFMEMSFNVDPVFVSIESSCPDRLLFLHKFTPSKRQLSISGLEITTNRLFGPQPRVATYMCIWNIHIGKIKGFLTTVEGQVLALVGKSFIHGFNDPFNAPAPEFIRAAERDATFLKVVVDETDVTWETIPAAIRLCLPEGLQLRFNNIARSYYRKMTSISIPLVESQLLLAPNASKRWLEAGRIRSSLSVDLYKAPKDWLKDAEQQKRFLEVQDAPTGRFASMSRASVNLDPPRWKNTLYLQTISAPHISSSSSKKMQDRLSSGSSYRVHGLNQHLSVDSASDEERLISEVDRDTRLANSRPNSHAVLAEGIEDDHSSPLDESDETGSSGSENSWSDYFEIREDRTKIDPRAHYWRLCRSFQLQRASKEFHCQSTFMAGKDIHVLQQPHPRGEPESPPTAFGSESNYTLGQIGWSATDTVDKSYTCLDIKDLKIFLTQLTVVSLGEILTRECSGLRSPELRLDALILDWMATSAEKSLSVYDIKLRTVQACIIQDVDGLVNVPSSTQYEGNARPEIQAIAVTDVAVEDAHFLLGIPLGDKEVPSDLPPPCGRFVIHKVAGSMGTLFSSPTSNGQNIKGRSLALKSDLRSFSGTFAKSKAEISVGSSELQLHRTAPEVVLAAGVALHRPFKDMLTAKNGHASSSHLRQQQLVYSVLNHNVMSKDLLSAVQPAFFVQSGRPQELRADGTWKLLFHLRHSLAEVLDDRYRLMEQDLENAPKETEMSLLLQNRQVPWAMEEGLHVMDVGLLKTLFVRPTKKIIDPMEKNNSRPVKSVGLRAGSLRMVLDSENHPQSSVTVQGIDFRADLLTRRLIFDAHTMSPYSSTVRSFKPNGEYVDYGSISALLALTVDSLQCIIYPGIITFLQTAIHVWRTLLPTTHPLKEETKEGSSTEFLLGNFPVNRVVACDVRVILNRMLIEAAAENMVFEIASKHVSSGSVGHVSKPVAAPTTFDISANHTMRFDELSFRAKARVREKYGEKDTLASLTVLGGLSSVLFQNHTPQGTAVRSTLHVDSVEFSFPRSGIRLYHYVEQWRQDYLGIYAMMQSLFTEIRQTSNPPLKQASVKKAHGILIDFNCSLSTVAIVLQVMHGTWLAWKTHGIVAYMKDQLGSKGTARVCGLQLASQTIQIMSTSSPKAGNSTTKRTPAIVLHLPSISMSGSFSAEQTDLLVYVGFLHVTIKPSHWDALLSVQQKFGQDFNDLLLIIDETQRKRPRSDSPKSSLSQNPMPFSMTGRFEGFEVGLEGLSSTQFFECEDIDATISNTGSLQYQVTLSDVALYLSSSSLSKKRVSPDRNQPSIMISVDLQVASYRPSPPENPQGRLELDISKIHAVLQAHMMSEIGDFIDYLQAEVLLRKEQRTLELNGFKEKARKLMKTFNVNPRPSSMTKQDGFLGSHIVTVSMSNLGAAFPLGIARGQASKFGMDEEITTKAFLFTIKSFKFQTQRGESGQALMEGFCFQFVSRFNPSNTEDFSADKHHTLNQMLYPEMTAKLRLETTLSARHIFVSAEISGFILDLDSSITGYAFSLIDAYRQGKQRVERLAAGLPRNMPDVDPITIASLPEHGDRIENRQSSTLTTSIEASLRFMSGTVRMHPTTKDMSAFSSISPDWQGRTYQILDSDAEIFNLPELSVWCEYRADSEAFGSPSPRDDTRSPVLVFKSTVHSSHNTLRPSLLPFVTEIVHNIEERMKRSTHRMLRPQPPSIQQSLSTLTGDEQSSSSVRPQESVSASLQLIFSLRIDKSRLELTCKPDANVVAGLHWESGGFVLNVSPGAIGVSVSASIGGITAGLKHGFLPEDSAHIIAKNLNFSINFAKASLSSGLFINSVSVVVDTEFSGSIRLSRLQDFLCFKAVWLDHIPVFNGDVGESASSPSKLSATSSFDQAPKQGFDTAIAIRVRQILLEMDLGQSISTVTFELQTALVRTHLTADFCEILVSIARVDMQARGNLSGRLRMPDFLFRTVRTRQGLKVERQPLSRMLELNLTTGTLDIQIQSDWLWLLQYRAEPLEAVIYDEWTTVSPSTSVKDQQLELVFSVSGTKVIAMMTIMAIPKLMMYAGKLRASLEAQREGASRESSVFRSTRFPKPVNALSEVANAMFHSARTKLKETESLSYVIGQRMKLKLDELVFVLLPRSQGGNELARFMGRNVMAQLDRIVQHDGQPLHRDLRLSLSHMSISQLLKQGFDPRLPGQEFDILTTSERNFAATENVIFSLPAMDMRMITDEEIGEGSRVLPYDFVSNFVRREGQEGTENINISFNISLYSWLTILRKSFTRELKRAKEVTEWRAVNISPPSTTAPRFTGPDMPTSPFAFGGDQTQSSPESRPSSRSPSRPSSPIRSKSVEPVIVSAPKKSSISKSPVILTSPKFVGGQSLSPLTRSMSASEKAVEKITAESSAKPPKIVYSMRTRKIERLTVRQLGEATPDVMHPFFTRKAGFNLEESLPQYVHEYATLPIEEIMKALVKLYSKQLN